MEAPVAEAIAQNVLPLIVTPTTDPYTEPNELVEPVRPSSIN